MSRSLLLIAFHFGLLLIPAAPFILPNQFIQSPASLKASLEVLPRSVHTSTLPAAANLDSTDQLTNEFASARESLQNCPSLWSSVPANGLSLPALVDSHHCDAPVSLTFSQVNALTSSAAGVFASLGVSKDNNAAIFCENSAYWLIADHAIQLTGAASAVRGAEASCTELRYIYSNSDAKLAVLQSPALLKRLMDDAFKLDLPSPLGLTSPRGNVETVILMHRGKHDPAATESMIDALSLKGVKVTFLDDMLYPPIPLSFPPPPNPPSLNDLATIVYTSGTTGLPKGVMLTHGNLLHQLQHRISPTKPYDTAEPLPGETMLSLLPVWHITERTFELWQLSRGCKVVYSSIRTFKNDLATHKPQWLVLVPRVLEKVAAGIEAKFKSGSVVQRGIVKVVTKVGTLRNSQKRVLLNLTTKMPTLLAKVKAVLLVAALTPLSLVGNKLVWSKVKLGFGGRQKCIISGGSALSQSLETFYDLAGIPIVVGYGLTETSPLVAHRRLDANLPVGGCVGKPTYQTELKVVDEMTREAVKDGSVGLVLARGPQVMRGYYNNEEATRAAIDADGFFDTGDLGRINVVTDDLVLTGRLKDTIVLSNGENVEPVPLEDAIMSGSDLIDQVMLIGDERKRLSAVCVLNLEQLVLEGFISQQESHKYGKMVDLLNDPKNAECAFGAIEDLKDFGRKLQSNSGIVGNVVATAVKSTGVGAGFRKWETVGDVLVVAEPFAMCNGQLTQSFKVKRSEVLKRYEALLN